MHEVDGQESQTDSAVEGDSTPGSSALPRRMVLAVGVAGVAGVALAACSSGSSGSSTSSSAGSASGSASESGSASASGTVVTTTSTVPVGGAKLANADGTTWLLAQPTKGEFVCHSGICTHEGCPLTEVQGAEGICRCHGSKFNADTGAVIQGPATKPLPKQSVKVSGSNIVLG